MHNYKIWKNENNEDELLSDGYMIKEFFKGTYHMSKGLDVLEEIKYRLSELDFKLRNRHETAPYIQETKWDTIEKELKALVVLKDLFDFDFALRFPSNQPMLRIENKRTNEYWEIHVAQEKYNLLKEVLE